MRYKELAAQPGTTCVACSMGNMPDPNGSHACIQCKKAVHALDGCSVPAEGSVEGHGQGRVCQDCARGKTGTLCSWFGTKQGATY